MEEGKHITTCPNSLKRPLECENATILDLQGKKVDVMPDMQRPPSGSSAALVHRSARYSKQMWAEWHKQ